MNRAFLALAALSLGAASCLSHASDPFPSKPVRVVVPYPAGGPVDIIGRGLGARLSKDWKMGVVIDSPVLAGAFTAWLESDRFTSVYNLHLKPDGQTIEWTHLEEEGVTSTTVDEPSSGWWLRLKLRLMSLLVDERDL